MSDFLLVPTNVQAFMIGSTGGPDPVYDLAPVPRTEDDVPAWYRDKRYSFSFGNEKLASLESGVHLHWALPTALTHSRHEDSNAPEQSCIPNRWLVVRMWHADDNPQISSKAWVVESDYVTSDVGSGGTPFPFFGASRPAELDGKYCGYVGRTSPLEGWQETHPEYRFDLKSHGWGDPSFAAYYPACKGMLGFHDTLEGVGNGNVLTYLVIGWYSDPMKDPLYGGSGLDTLQACLDRLASLGWSCTNLGTSDGVPQRTLAHGSVVGVTWQGPNKTYPASSGGADKVAIGGSAAEAFAALLAPDENQESLQQIFSAFQHGQATQVSAPDQLGDLLHRHSFSAVPGGKLWAVEPVTRSADAQASSTPLSADVQLLLNELNTAQQAFDRQASVIVSLRSRLFACWATWASKQTGPPTKRPNQDAVNRASLELQTATDGLQKYSAEVERCRTSVTDALTAEKTGMQLVESTKSPFLHPKDPFVVLQGDQLVGLDRTRAQRPDTDVALHCRLARDVVTGVSVSGTVAKTCSAKDCFQMQDFIAPTGTPPFEVTQSLALESLLFDPNCASRIDTGDPTLFNALQQSLDPSRTSNSSNTTLAWIGQPPDPLGITRWGLSNPWLPVYLMWQAHWLPSYHKEGSDSNPLAGWQFDSNALAGDLVPGEGGRVGDDAFLEGATIISTLSGDQLAMHLAAFGADGLDAIRNTLVLGQSLGGLNDLLLRQALGLFLPPIDPTVKQLDVSMWDAMGQAPQPVMPIAGAFLPVRTGALKIVSLFLVDSFGQTKKLIDSTHSSSAPKPIASAALPPPQAGYHAAFSPRLVQPARLNFDWQPADTASPGPVCGWIVANYVEKSFAVFSPSGEPIGALASVLPALGEKTINSNVTFQWRPIPGSTLAIEQVSNARLRRFLELVTNFTADEGQAFLELVDLVLRRTDGRIPAEDPAMSVLLGRPLALVNASVGLEFEGLPAGYWKTDGAWTFESEGFEHLRVPVRLGGMSLPADGLVGYLSENGAPCLCASDGATVRIGDSSRIKYGQELTVACSDDPPVSLTLLMDANARVHATTGILPRHSVVLPSEATRLARLIQEVYVGVAPVLGERPRESASQPTMPRPADAFGQWSWATRPDLTGQTQRWHEMRPADDRARFADGLALTEGWLRLRLQPHQGDAAPVNES